MKKKGKFRDGDWNSRIARSRILRMSPTKVYSLYRLGDRVTEKCFSEAEDFSEQKCSLFKYGNKKIAAYYGFLLAKYIYSELIDLVAGQELIVASTTRRVLPQAATYLANYVVEYFSVLAFQGLIKKVGDVQLHIINPISGEYGKLSMMERKKVMRDTFFSFDKQIVQRKTVLFIEDIITTGTLLEKVVVELKKAGALVVNTACIIKMDEEVGVKNPELESKLSNAAVIGIRELNQVLTSPDYCLMARSCKRMLMLPEDDLKGLVNILPDDLLLQLYTAIVGEGYTQGGLEKGFGVISTLVKGRLGVVPDCFTRVMSQDRDVKI